MRALALIAVASLALGGCGNKVRSCKSGTVLLSVDLPDGTDSVEIVVTVDGTASAPQSVALPGGLTHGTIELDFGHYPAGQMVTVAVTALGGGSALGSATSDLRALAGNCDSITLAVTGSGGDGGVGDDLSVGGGVTCSSAADCPVGQACDTGSGGCTATCSATQPCNGGCCAGTTCATGTTSDACALGQPLCGSCVVSTTGKACLNFGGANTCGCTNAADCPANQACNTTTHTCGSACDSTTPCNGGCCSAATGGNCQTGTAKTVCGNNGSLCGDCTNNQNGHQCTVVTGGGQCGCAAIGDCPGTSTACTANLCVNSCSSSMACLSGCCSAATAGTCQPGTSQTVCGAVGTQCKSCVGNATGTACLTSGKCGCTNANDCAAGFACDLSLGQCTTSCNANQPCRGGCCSSAGSCVGGGSTAACGSAGTACAVCATNTSCATYTCDGTSCITSFASSSTVCNPADPNNCFFAARCTGSSPNCPSRVNMCTNGACCTAPNHCTNPCP